MCCGSRARTVPFFMSFMTLGIFWVGQQTQLNHLTRADRNLAWLHLTFLLPVTFVPFTTSFLAELITYRSALLIYWFNILMLGVVLFATWRYAKAAGLVKDDASDELVRAVERRIVSAQVLYGFGAALCAINTYVSIGFIVLLQLNYAIAPRIRFLYRL